MTCQEINLELVAYHFGTVSPESRQQVEEHLVGCQECLKSFLSVKREIETAEAEPRASPAARARLRRDVALLLHPPRRTWSWWERPLAFGFAGAAVMVAMLAVHVVVSSQGSMPHSLAAHAGQGSVQLHQ
jgi:anti-sigma factor RsiW